MIIHPAPEDDTERIDPTKGSVTFEPWPFDRDEIDLKGAAGYIDSASLEIQPAGHANVHLTSRHFQTLAYTNQGRPVAIHQKVEWPPQTAPAETE